MEHSHVMVKLKMMRNHVHNNNRRHIVEDVMHSGIPNYTN